MQRFKFVGGSKLAYRSQRPLGASIARQTSPRLLSPMPTNETSLLAQDLTTRLQQSEDIRHSISWSWGQLLHEIPQRLGRNKALDSAARTILLDHADACIGENKVDTSTPGVVHLFRTLSFLRAILDDPNQRAESETLCAVMLASISQVGTSTY